MPSTFHLPSIDITPYLADPTSTAGQKVLDEVRAACTSTGFFLLRGHGIPRELQDSLLAGATKFFALPNEVKLNLDAKNNVGFLGYDPMGSHSYEANVLPDLKEEYYYGTEIPLDDPRLANGGFFQGRNVFPPTELLSDESFRKPLEAYYDALIKLSWIVFDLVIATMPYDPHVWDDCKANTPVFPLRLLHYPPGSEHIDGESRQLSSSAHRDFGAVTLLLQDGHSGLEVQHPETGEWIGVPPDRDTYVVNLGQMIARVTGGQYKSSLHRVVNRNPTDRYSVVFFVDGNLDFKLRRLDKRPEEDPDAPTVAQHFRELLMASYKLPREHWS
ncbi:isopenicillin N synthase family dioxygenase [Aspergillus ibericus CBS 121593]|uniref:Putative 2OG-Fe(II) oxygenase family oxidoreductase n=1 Tax=Aspergillus ibericus CBS 121593 TaxID=1448316 RepID=A0A395H9H9_9EURO|nr:putative 2OG-Fe(II) oxygenase family oxidoreductase [Aspergillus ibericus CBS 121593]RAL04512.1 putative 2OG-Fe(II) oxygenase family oxidoreductase [Aspergillus ibericus CBS 121593]